MLKYYRHLVVQSGLISSSTDVPFENSDMKNYIILIFIIVANAFKLKNPFSNEGEADKANNMKKSAEKIEEVRREKQIQLILFNVDDIIDINNNEIKISLN